MRTPSTNVDIVLDDEPDSSAADGEILIVTEGQSAPSSAVDTEVVNLDANPLDQLPENAIRNKDGSVTLPLLYPVSVNIQTGDKLTSKKYSELKFNRLVGADQRAIAAAKDADQVVVTFARSTKIMQLLMNAIFDKMDAADITRGGQVLNHFLSSGNKRPGK